MAEQNAQNDAMKDIIEGMEQNFRLLDSASKEFAQKHDLDLDPFNLSDAYAKWFQAALENPQSVIDASLDYWQDSIKLYQNAVFEFWGIEAESQEEVIQPEPSDRRFRHEAWADQPVFSAIKQSYLLASRWARDSIANTEGLDDKTAEKVAFFTERGIEGMSPTNFAMTNPAVIEKTIESKGQNLADGFSNMMNDLEDGQLKIKMTDASAFTLGENIATTPGKVVAQTPMFQLLQFEPTTKKVFEKPLLIIPPWINKYYILDLQPKNSMIKWLVDQGHTVFVVSWVNPDANYAQIGFEDYLKKGVLEATNLVEKISGQSSINAIGYCIGGTLLATALAYMKAKNDQRIATATFFTTMLDFEEPGELGVFIDEEQLTKLEEQMSETGFLEGESMAGSFNLLRANDLIWSFYINNYLMGNAPRPFDLLYWNSDSTRMPAKMHSWYLRNLYLENKLAHGEVVIDEVPIDLTTVDTPSCFVSTEDDHIAPWLSTYSGAQLFSGPVEFILGGSGHIAGIVNPPDANKYYYKHCETLPKNAEKWAQSADKIEGSWWPCWQAWVAPQSGTKIAARKPGSTDYPVMEDAPGSYVKRRIDAAENQE